MSREEGLQRMNEIYGHEDPKIIDLCIKRMGLTHDDLEEILEIPPKSYTDYPNNLQLIATAKPVMKALSVLGMIPESAYLKYCGWKNDG